MTLQKVFKDFYEGYDKSLSFDENFSKYSFHSNTDLKKLLYENVEKDHSEMLNDVLTKKVVLDGCMWYIKKSKKFCMNEVSDENKISAHSTYTIIHCDKCKKKTKTNDLIGLIKEYDALMEEDDGKGILKVKGAPILG